MQFNLFRDSDTYMCLVLFEINAQTTIALSFVSSIIIIYYFNTIYNYILVILLYMFF